MRRRLVAALSSFVSLGTWLIAIGGALLFLLLFRLGTQRRTAKEGEGSPLAH